MRETILFEEYFSSEWLMLVVVSVVQMWASEAVFCLEFVYQFYNPYNKFYDLAIRVLQSWFKCNENSLP